MRKSRVTDEQIIGKLKEHHAELSAVDLYRKQGISVATFYKWWAKYGGTHVSDAKNLKTHEDENNS